MTTEAKAKNAKFGKTALQMLLGAAFGAGGMIAVTTFLPVDKLAADEFILVSIGAIWAIIGAFVLIGSASPKWGAKLLNVSDEDDLRDQRQVLVGSSIACLALGGAQIVAALSGRVGLFPAWAGVLATVCALGLCIVIYIRDRHRYDEFLWKLTLDASYHCFVGLWAIVSIWCASAMAGLMAAPTPGALLALFSGGYLLATFIAAGRAGLLKPQ